MDLTADHSLATDLAAEAGSLLMELRAELSGQDAPGAVLKAEGDRQANEHLLSRLADERPNDGVLSEEAADDLSRLERSRVWIIDPLDGTREFSEPPRRDWAVHVALAIDGVPVVGAVALPGLDLVLDTADVPILASLERDAPRVIVSRTRPPEVALAVTEALGGELVEMGSAGAKAMAVVRGEAEIYVHAGGQYEWDNCAPTAVALASGLHASRIDRSPLIYNNENPYLPDLLICRQEFAEAALDVLN
ncbi:MAG: 3'(2'),5'-bisphosphate nucleotidase CysQ [Acidobacteria bacterium]|nr:3'(2'),5'-bisphosphate nucleotidase CysQ [Acidobacteriota bacterium]